MDKSMVDLYVKFKEIKKMGYVRSYKDKNNSGITFEHLLGKEQDEFFLPDHNGIELKTKKGYSKTKIALFTANPDGKYLFAIQNLVEQYGVNKRKFLTELSAIDKHRYNGYYFQIYVDWQNKKVVLLIFDKLYNLISKDIWWTFELLKERVYLKLKKLALVKCCTRKIDNVEYYWYYRIFFYKNVNFNNFLEAIEKAKLQCVLK